MLIPGLPKLYIKDDGFTPPSDPVYYLLTGSGLFRGHNMPLFSSLTKVEDGIRGLQEQEEQLDLRLPKIPKFLIERAVGFFREVYDRHRSEAVLLIHYSPEKRHYRFVAPPQTVTVKVYTWYEVVRDEVEYETVPAARGYQQVGSIHSHGAMPAFQSWQDEQDARSKQGLHIVVGSLTWRPKFDVAFSIGGRRFDLKLEDVAEGFDEAILPAPKVWWQQVKCEREHASTYGSDGGYYQHDDYHSSATGYSDGHGGFGPVPD